MFSFFWSWTYNYIRLLVKWFLRKTTGLCELQRICYGEEIGAPRTLGVEKSLHLSRNTSIQSLITYLNSMSEQCRIVGEMEKEILKHSILTVLQAKKINPTIHNRFGFSFGLCVRLIWGYKQMYHEIENLRTTQYSSENLEHEAKLLQLWRLLRPDEELENRISKQWQDIGFQGDDPKTDFRGMGILGLENLLYFSTEYPDVAKHVLSHSLHPTYGYAFAIVGINITSLAYRLMVEGDLRTHIYNYNYSKSTPTIKHFHQFYCYLFYEFDKYWIESKPANIMDFSRILQEFETNIRSALTNLSTVFKINVAVDNI
ncbi:ELMO domain-containing protein 2 [Chrysoperla carnea]|uniref:ELMO domain-containing protein 2 n=1 Tax=Chrysoperla carnea TaxID=189513 RepID=UPI001D069184|nr:ELMO domain-containing protein 2 [Chrysoperla carnea]